MQKVKPFIPIDSFHASSFLITNVQSNARLACNEAAIYEDETYMLLSVSFAASGKDGYAVMGKIEDKLCVEKIAIT